MVSLHSLHRSQSLHEQTHQALRTAILSGELTSGTRLVETQLAEKLRVSRTPIREAIRQLQREKLVMPDINGGLCVATLSTTDAIHLYDCRIALEQLSVSEACKNVTVAQLEKLDLAVLQAEKTIGYEPHQLTNFQLLHMDYQFHRLLANSSGNAWLLSSLDQLFDMMALLRIRTMQHNPRVLEIRSEHRQIYQAVAERNASLATKAIKEHLVASKERVVREVQELEQQSSTDSFPG